jgi:hypothetical protein
MTPTVMVSLVRGGLLAECVTYVRSLQKTRALFEVRACTYHILGFWLRIVCECCPASRFALNTPTA